MVSKRWSWLAGIAVLFAGLTNAHSHVHYCFDGQEPPAAVHLVDGTDHTHEVPGHKHELSGHEHDAHDQGTEHDDLDVDVPNQALAKAVKHDLSAITTPAWIAPLEPLPGGAIGIDADNRPAPHPRYRLPPLRAPPP